MPTSSGFSVGEVLTSTNTNKYLLRSGRNALINGAMSICQRGASTTGIAASGYFSADRWALAYSSLGTWTQSVQDVTASGAPMADGIRNSLKMTCTAASSAAAGAYNVMLQAIEGYNLQQFAKGNTSAKPFALSFWVRSNVTGTYVAELYDVQNSRTVSASYTIAASGTWQKVRIVFPADTVSGFLNDASGQMQLLLWIGAGSNYTSGTLQTTWGTYAAANRAVGQVNVASAINNYFEFTAVQLEPDAVCTPFEQEDVQVTLAKCQRYFQKHYQPSLRGVCASGAFQRLTLHIQQMRVAPTITSNGGTMGFFDGVTAVVGNIAFTATYTFTSLTTIEVDISSGGWTAGRAAVFYQGSGHTFQIDLNSEL